MNALQSFEVVAPVKLAAAWAATVGCYIYCDYFALYIPGKLANMSAGSGPFGPVDQMSMVGAALLLIIPCVMSFLSVALRPTLNRALNIGFGLGYTVLMLLLAISTRWYFYKLFAVVEAVLTATIVWMAWKWPREQAPRHASPE